MNKRLLSREFMNDLLHGKLSALLLTVKQDHSLCLEIRSDYINIYYRGGNLLTVTKKVSDYDFKFDFRYVLNNGGIWDSPTKEQFNCLEDYLRCVPQLKREMDFWFSKHQKLEREIQQAMLRENNLTSISGDTDYFIADIEYANTLNQSRFDVLGIKWLSNSVSRKNVNEPSLVLSEVKYGDNALTGSAGIVKHFEDLQRFIDRGCIVELSNEVNELFNQKIELGLISNLNKHIIIDQNRKPEFIIILANHKPASTLLKRELIKALAACPELTKHIDIRIAQSSLMGYGLYEVGMIPILDYINA